MIHLWKTRFVFSGDKLLAFNGVNVMSLAPKIHFRPSLDDCG